VKDEAPLNCAGCDSKECVDGKDCFGERGEHLGLYRSRGVTRLHEAASAIEARHYGSETRLGEIVRLGKELACPSVGLAFCVGLSEEACVVEEILSRHFEVLSVCCKACGITKREVGLEQISDDRDEVMCNPAGMASLLNGAGTKLNVLCGLCVGHDAIFSMISDAPVTTLIAKDRVLAHNPAGAVYCRYVRRNL
jgi:uncharacterized metal-binding protein